MEARRAVAIVAAVLALSVSACATSSSTTVGDEARVQRVVDGDTLVLADDTRVRLIGIDTPETVDPRRPVECFGHEASNRLRELLPPGTRVRLEYDIERTDRYGRTLAYVHRAGDGLFVNLAMAREGYAEQLTVPPNVAHAHEIGAAVEAARAQRLGLWSEGACVSR